MIEKRYATGLRSCRKAAGLTLQQVGDAVFHSYVRVSLWERSKAPIPPDVIAPICALLGCTEEDIFAAAPTEPQVDQPAIVEAMFRSGLGVSELAEAMGVSRQTVYNWFGGRMPQPERMERLCEVLGCTEAELRGEAEA